MLARDADATRPFREAGHGELPARQGRVIPVQAASPTPSNSTSGQHVIPSIPLGAAKLFLLKFYAPCLRPVANRIQTRSIEDVSIATEIRRGTRLKPATAVLVSPSKEEVVADADDPDRHRVAKSAIRA